jgi:hypothetical protein
MSGPKSKFNAQGGLCNQGGRVALEETAPAKVQQDFIIDQLAGMQEILRAAETEKAPACKKPAHVADVPFRRN